MRNDDVTKEIERMTDNRKVANMNERIKDMVLNKGFARYDDEIEKLCLIIIKECLDQCYNKGMNDSLYEGQLKAASYIEQHFGINDE